MHDEVRQLARHDLFSNVPPDELGNLQRVCRVERVEKDSPIYRPVDPSDSVYLVCDGRIRICHLTRGGKRSTLAYIDPDEVFGELAVLGQSQREEYSEAAKESKLIRMPAAQLVDLMRHLPLFGLQFLRLVGLRRQRVERRLRNLLYSSNRDRLIHLILELADRYGVAAKDGVRLTTDLSHQDLASMIGSTRETVTLVLGELQAEGLIKLGRRKITLVRPATITGLVERLPGSALPAVFQDVLTAETSAG